jgi:hypothetical protein
MTIGTCTAPNCTKTGQWAYPGCSYPKAWYCSRECQKADFPQASSNIPPQPKINIKRAAEYKKTVNPSKEWSRRRDESNLVLKIGISEELTSIPVRLRVEVLL